MRFAAGIRWSGLSATQTRHRLLITADGGGSNGSRVRLWKLELQKLADDTGLTLQVCHYPPGTSKWNKIEHRMFCHITQTWRGKPLTSRVAVVDLIAATTTKTGPDGAVRTGREKLCQGHQGHRCRDGHPEHRERPLASRVELHHQAPAARSER